MSTRRNVLGFLAVGLAAAGVGATSSCGNSATRSPAPDDAVRGRAVEGARSLAGLYEAAIVHSSIDSSIDRTQAATYRDHHLAHARRLMTATSDATTGTSTAAATAVAAAVASPTRASLAAAELAAMGTSTSAADINAVSGSLAALLASIAACRALHARSLGGVPDPGTSAAPALTVTKSAGSDKSAPGTDASSVAALQTLLSAENAAIFAFGALGPHLTGSQCAAAHAAFDLHRNQRDVLMDAITVRGAAPQAAEASYRLPFAVGDAASACRLAALIETRLTTVSAEVVSTATATGNCRAYAAWALTQAALRAQTWGTPISVFPGLST